MQEFETKAGALVKINPADFESAIALKSAVAKEISEADLELQEESDPADLIKLAALVDSSDAVHQAVFRCLKRCTYDGHKITKATFEPVEARNAYYDIVIACLRENLAPFFEGLLTKLKPYMDQFQKQTSQK